MGLHENNVCFQHADGSFDTGSSVLRVRLTVEGENPKQYAELHHSYHVSIYCLTLLIPHISDIRWRIAIQGFTKLYLNAR